VSRSCVPISLTVEQRAQLESWVAAFGTPQQVALRCRIVLALADGDPETVVGIALNTNRKTVRLWSERFRQEGCASLWEVAPGRGRKVSFSAEQVKAVLDATLRSKPRMRLIGVAGRWPPPKG
jgi:hypothetical protein